MSPFPIPRSRGTIAAAAILLALAACGGENGTGPGPGPGPGPTLANGTMTARIDGAPWRASFLVQAHVTDNGSGSTIQITGADTVGLPVTRAKQIVITIIPGVPPAAGSYPIGVLRGSPPPYSSIGMVVQSASSWSTPLATAAPGVGTMTVTSLTATRIAGTFSFTAAPTATNPAADQSPAAVTEGTFDIKLTQ
jgi:hypothetical protein